MLRSIVKQYTVDCSNEMSVLAYSWHPELCIKDTTGARNIYTLTFADEITKFGDLLKEERLGEAYQRAGISFKGLLEKDFVVLRETQGACRVVIGSNLNNKINKAKHLRRYMEKGFRQKENSEIARRRRRGKDGLIIGEEEGGGAVSAKVLALKNEKDRLKKLLV
jgi:hypothetical protein